MNIFSLTEEKEIKAGDLCAARVVKLLAG